jgi:hypothetical protein
MVTRQTMVFAAGVVSPGVAELVDENFVVGQVNRVFTYTFDQSTAKQTMADAAASVSENLSTFGAFGLGGGETGARSYLRAWRGSWRSCARERAGFLRQRPVVVSGNAEPRRHRPLPDVIHPARRCRRDDQARGQRRRIDLDGRDDH